MKKMICVFLSLVLSFGIVSQAVANETMHLEEVSTAKTVKPIAYTHDFDGYSNVVGVLNSDGTKTAYLFSSPQQAEQVETITQLIMPEEFILQQNSTAQTRDGTVIETIMDAPVYSGTETTNYGSTTQMIIGEASSQNYGRTYMKFDLSFLIAEAITYHDILSACLYFTEVESEIIERAAPSVIQAYLVDGQWNENTINWENKPDYYGYEMIGCADVGTYVYDDYGISQPIITNELYITKAIMAWLQGLPNNGIVLKEKEDQYENHFYTSEDLVNSPYITVTYSTTSVTWGRGISNGSTYYIANKATGEYLTATTDVTGINLTCEQFCEDEDPETRPMQQWTFTMNSAGTGYTISLGNTGLCIRSRNSPSSGENAIVQLGNAQTNSYQLWRPFRNWNGTYHFQVRVSSGVSMKASQENENVVQEAYSCDFAHYDEWTLIPTTKGAASFFDFHISNDINTTYGTDVMLDYAQELGYGLDLVNAEGTTNLSAREAFLALQRSSLFYFSGHGLPGRLLFFNQSKDSLGSIAVSDDLVASSLDRSLDDLIVPRLSQLQLAVFSTCYTGKNPFDENNESLWLNMTGKVYQLGAHNVVSYFNETTQPYDLGWNSAFMTNVLLGRSLKTAKFRADNHIYDDYFMTFSSYVQNNPYGNMNERHDLGDENAVLGFTIDNALAKNNYNYQAIPATIDKNSLVDMAMRLPKDAINGNAAPCESNVFDVYADEYGGVYWYYQGKNLLHSYEPYTENLKLGNVNVNGAAAMFLAQRFLQEKGYAVANYDVITSNEFSKNYKIEFHSNIERKKLVFHMQADEEGEVHINSFSAFVENYGN